MNTTFEGKINIMAEGGISFTKNSKGKGTYKQFMEAVKEIRGKLLKQGKKNFMITVINSETGKQAYQLRKGFFSGNK
jgi:ribosomal protein S11